MSRLSRTWLDDLPFGRLIAEISLWSADLTRLAADVARIEPFADVFHIDVADGHFAPALLFFPDLVSAIRKTTHSPIHVHLMVSDDILLSQIDQFIDAGSDLISIHVENDAVADAALARIEAAGIAAGMVLKVGTPVAAVGPYLPRLRFLTLLGTEIGVKGQHLNESAGERLAEAKRMIAGNSGRRIVLAADGGIREHTVPFLRAAGADSAVLGSLAFGAPDLRERMAWFHAV